MNLYFQDFEQKVAATNASVKENSKHVFETKIELEEGPEFYKLSTSTKEEIKYRFLRSIRITVEWLSSLQKNLKMNYCQLLLLR